MSRRRQRSTGGRLFIWILVLGLLVAALMYLRCGEGFGFGPGGGDEGDEEETAPAADKDAVRPAVGSAVRCQLRLDANGLTVDGQAAEVDAAVATCKKAGGAELVATGDAVFGTLEELKTALDREGVQVLVRDPQTAPRTTP